MISIHAPHAGSDELRGPGRRHQRISIHAPHAGSDDEARRRCGLPELFQSTLPMRGATTILGIVTDPTTISIHAPHAGSDGLTQG